jgi:cellobiose phosphorylase
MEQFDKLRDSSVNVKTGWRIYSSGSGLYISRLVNDILGIKRLQGDWLIDPVMDSILDGLKLEMVWDGMKITFIYRKNDENRLKISVDGNIINNEPSHQPYRQGGVRIKKDIIKNGSLVEVFYN